MSKRITNLNPTLKRFFINFICVFWAGFLFIFAGHISAQTTVRPFDWEQIIPLVTKKIEVENILGKPFFEDRYVSAYNLEKGKITVWYYGTRKPDTSEYRCNISLDTVSSFSISLLDRINVSALEFDLRKFKKEEGHTSERRYTDDENGISFDVDQTEDGLEWVKSFDYYGSRSKVKTLCSRERGNAVSIRALILIHEAVHQFGQMHDKDFDTKGDQGTGSRKITDAIVDNCFPVLRTQNLAII